MLKVEHLKKTFDDLTAVDNVSFNIGEGEIMGIIGQNGAGKTTTFRLILDLLKPEQGKVTWKGHKMNPALFNEIGYLPEERGLYPKLSIEEQLYYFASLRGKSKKEINPKIDEWMERFQVKGKRTDKVQTLSKGNQQKVQLITTLIHEPQLIILDEPFSGLDPVNAELLEDGIRYVQSTGASIIFSSHNMNNVEQLCQSLIMLKNGNQVLSGSIREIRQKFGRTKLCLESPLSREELLAIEGVEVKGLVDGAYVLHLANEELGRRIFDLATKDGYIPTFNQQTPSLEEIFKKVAGEGNE